MSRTFDRNTTLAPDQVFVGLPKLERPKWMSDYVDCPKCEAHGCWHYSTNTKMACGFCNGYGYVSANRAAKGCDHKWKHVASVGRCLNKYECVNCGAQDTVDSGD
jgi:hypothetical protein